ncbi:FG-GAP-like repeat-containing protein [Flavobacterium sp. LS1R49]|uniref:FG-GAP-like repeat-containing protein n=1 Tax=Flavobacterium shii TaxID=2987687 RepID=A0A9X2ZD83_9FLAO|nr:FG-GAP-like repeat-containing protein [Flavobacterium shii]MCV9926616.1 FG-GAP-like repeat-containing protein [Flavobacterium shii]
MKQFYFSLLFITYSLFTIAQTTPTGSSTETGITDGQLTVSLTGAANYNIPIDVPPGINGVVPQISLSYSSQSGYGIAGLGWNISGISSITRIAATKFHDGTINGVNFDSFDRFALDGQRLIAKSGTYGANGTVYETENYSNLRITSYGVHSSGVKYGPAYFIVEYPDGSKAYYGNSTDSVSVTSWAITYSENLQGVRMSYSYNVANNVLNLASIKYGTRTTTAPINEIRFSYVPRTRVEQAYIGGQNLITDTLLKEIKVFGNSVGYRTYTLAYMYTSAQYERLERITETSGDGSKSYNPTVFTYETTGDSINYSANPQSLSVGSITSDNAETVSGDFDGDGSMDFILYPTKGPQTKSKFWLFTGINPNRTDQSVPNWGVSRTVDPFDEIFPVSWLSWNNKLMPMQGWTIAYQNGDGAKLVTYSYCDTFQICPQYEKYVGFPTFTYYTEDPLSCEKPRPALEETLSIPKMYISGDFNGDGLTDIVAIEKKGTYNYLGPCQNGELPSLTGGFGGGSYFINMDRRLTTNFMNSSGPLPVQSTSKVKVADFDGDGKSDVYIFDTGRVRIYSLNDNKQFVLVNETTDVNIVFSTEILMGDYNGDGKEDFMIARGPGFGEWYRYSSTGVGLIKETKTYGSFTFPANDPYNTYNFTATDYDNDGKSDLLVVSSSRNTANTAGTLSIKSYSRLGGIAVNLMQASSGLLAGVDISALPVFLPTVDKNKPKLEIAFLNNDKLYFFNSLKDSKKDCLLKTITTGSGVRETITYQPLDPTYKNSFNSIYSSSRGMENYPYYDIVASPDFQIVTKLEKQSATVYKKQLFGYYGAVTNYEGLGFIGFRSVMQTNWHDDTTAPLSNISKKDIYLRGALTENYALNYMAYPYEGFTAPSFLSKSVLTYNTATEALQLNKVFKLQNKTKIDTNGLNQSSSETTTLYDALNNPIKSTTLIKEGGSSIIQTNISDITYEPPTTTTSLFIVGRPLTKDESVAIADHTMTTQESYTYNGQQLLHKVEKKGTGTGIITEENGYDIFGNITKKTITAPALTPRITDYEYDLSGRFITKVTDLERLETNFEYDTNNGLLKKETNAYGLSNSYTYDRWYKKLTAKNDNLNKSTAYSYSKNLFKTIITETGDDGSASEETFDDLSRKIKSGTKDINGTFSYVDYQYDIYDRNFKVSEPYFGSSASQWNETLFDIYSRPVQNNFYTGKVTTSSYPPGMTSTFTDGTKTKTTTINAVGNIISQQENIGGIINYKYFANGNLKQTDYNGTSIKIEQDGWGRKTKLTDPTAGTYVYENNDFGELKSETVQNRGVVTTITRNEVGKPIKKTITGPLTDTETIYEYDNTTKLPILTTFTDKLEPTGTNTIYTRMAYDPVFKRIISIVEEKTGISKFTNTFAYDDLGRIEIETKKAELGAKMSTVVIKNVYKNGDLFQIVDNLTNKILWQTNILNARGQMVENIVGNGITMTNTYDSDGYLTKIQHDRTVAPAGNVMTLTTNFNKTTDNLDNRSNNTFGNWAEIFKYDDLDRLKEFTNGLGTQVNQNYEASGKIKDNMLGTYNYDTSTKPNQNTSITLSPEAELYYKNRGIAFFDDMEGQTGWSKNAYDPLKISFGLFSNYNGKHGLRLDTSGANMINYVTANKTIQIDNTIDTEYKISAWVYTSNPKAQLTFLEYRKNETTPFKSEILTTKTRGEWIFLEKTILVPASIKLLEIRADAIGTQIGNGFVSFDDVKLTKASVNALTKLDLDIKYNASNSPSSIEEKGIDILYLTYNGDGQRSIMFYGGVVPVKESQPLRKHYSADGTMEIKENRVTGAIEFVTYVGGDGYLAPAVSKSDGINQANYLYLHRDYQGNIMAITDESGQIVEKRLYDAWGKILKVQDGVGTTLAGLTILDRGYTGHEHLQSIGLINMNSRLYDPVLHRFLSADNYVQNIGNTQNFNQYGYVYNNPLRYTDPSGDICEGCGGIQINPGDGNGSYTSTDLNPIWDKLKIKDWANRNLNFDKWSDGFKSGGNWVSDNFKSIFGIKSHESGPPPNMSNYVNINTYGGSIATTGSGQFYGGTGNGSFMDYFSRFVYETDQFNPVALLWDGLKGNITGSDRYGNELSGFDSNLKIVSAVPMTTVANLVTNGARQAFFAEVKAVAKEAVVHGNSLKSLKPTWGYKLYSSDGTFLKNGITSKPNPLSRYTKAFMEDKQMIRIKQFPNRLEAYQWEYQQNVIKRGTLNKNMH